MRRHLHATPKTERTAPPDPSGAPSHRSLLGGGHGERRLARFSRRSVHTAFAGALAARRGVWRAREASKRCHGGRRGVKHAMAPKMRPSVATVALGTTFPLRSPTELAMGTVCCTGFGDALRAAWPGRAADGGWRLAAASAPSHAAAFRRRPRTLNIPPAGRPLTGSPRSQLPMHLKSPPRTTGPRHALRS
jgi:hypothetical protein